jgi:hypothetical protein
MATDEPVFEETSVIPTGRKARVVPAHLWTHLEDSAKRRVGKVHTAAPEVIAQLRRDLTSAAVQAKYEVTTATEKLESGMHKMTFAAKRKPKPPNPEAAK